jgi:hypothetical protein
MQLETIVIKIGNLANLVPKFDKKNKKCWIFSNVNSIFRNNSMIWNWKVRLLELFDLIWNKNCWIEIEIWFRQLNNLFNSIIWIDFVKKNWIEKDQFSTKTHLQKHSLLHDTVFLHKLKSILQRKILLGIFFGLEVWFVSLSMIKTDRSFKKFFLPFQK